MEYLWLFVVVGGPILLGAALAYATIRYLRRDKRLDAMSERSARKVREDIRRDERTSRRP